MSKRIAATLAIGAIIAGSLILFVATRPSTQHPTAAVPPISSPSASSSVQASTTPPAPTENLASSSSVATSNWKSYRNEKYGFELAYPPNWIVFQAAEIKLTPLGSRGVGFFYVPFGPQNGFHIGVQLVCRDFNYLENRNTAGNGNDISLTIDGKKISVLGENPAPRSPGEEGEPFGFRVSYCGSSTSSRTTCVVFNGFNTPMDKSDISFIESIHFSKSLDTLANNCPQQ